MVLWCALQSRDDDRVLDLVTKRRRVKRRKSNVDGEVRNSDGTQTLIDLSAKLFPNEELAAGVQGAKERRQLTKPPRVNTVLKSDSPKTKE